MQHHFSEFCNPVMKLEKYGISYVIFLRYFFPVFNIKPKFNSMLQDFLKLYWIDKHKILVLQLTLATNIDFIPNLSRNVFAISAVGDLEATATSMPLSLSAHNIPLAWGYSDGISRLERHSLKNKQTRVSKGLIKRKTYS